MASLIRPTEATYVIHDKVTVETADNEDHTFCGVMFPVKCKDDLPLDHIIINSVAVRGRLGPLTVWVSKEETTNQNRQRRQFRMHPRYWTKIYEKTHAPSFQRFVELDLSENPIRLRPGQIKAIYIHSTLPGDEAIVYDNRHHRRTYDDGLVSILTGRAHVSERPFGTTPIWGWGNPWRDQREFVGRIEYGAVYRLWNPATAQIFGPKFQQMSRTLFMCQRRWESPLSMLPDDCIFYILNMCRWDWASDTPDLMKDQKKRRLAKAAAKAAASDSAMSESDDAAAAPSGVSSDSTTNSANAVQNETSRSCCIRRASQQEEEENVESDDGEFHDANSEEEDDDDEEVDDVDEDDEEVDDVDEEDGEEEEEVDEEEDETWENDNDDGYNADNMVFRYHDDSDEEDDEQEHLRNRQAWIRRQFARIHVLQALAELEDDRVVEMDH